MAHQQQASDNTNTDAVSAALSLSALGGGADSSIGMPAVANGNPSISMNTNSGGASHLLPMGKDSDKSQPTKQGQDPETQDNKSTSASSKDEEISTKRYLPDHKKPDSAPTFPEKMMALMRFAETKGEDFCIQWLPDNKSFIIRDADTFTKQVVPKYFKPTKFSSFTRKLYRWGFRQINRGIGQDDPIIFGNEYFQKGNPELMAKMKSTTAAATRKAEEMAHHLAGVIPVFSMKRNADDMVNPIELQQQILLSQLLHKKSRFSDQQLPQQQLQQMKLQPQSMSNQNDPFFAQAMAQAQQKRELLRQQELLMAQQNPNNMFNDQQDLPSNALFAQAMAQQQQQHQQQRQNMMFQSHNQDLPSNSLYAQALAKKKSLLNDQDLDLSMLQQAQQQPNDVGGGQTLSLQNMMRPSLMNAGNPMMMNSFNSNGNNHSNPMNAMQSPQGSTANGKNLMNQGSTNNDSSILGQFLPNTGVNGNNGMSNGAGSSRAEMMGGPPSLPPSLTGYAGTNNSSTSDIVNAAIEALRYG